MPGTSNPHPASVFLQNVEQTLLEGVKWCLFLSFPFLACLISNLRLDWLFRKNLLLRLCLILWCRCFLSAPSGFFLFFLRSRLRFVTGVAFSGLDWSVRCDFFPQSGVFLSELFFFPGIDLHLLFLMFLVRKCSLGYSLSGFVVGWFSFSRSLFLTYSDRRRFFLGFLS